MQTYKKRSSTNKRQETMKTPSVPDASLSNSEVLKAFGMDNTSGSAGDLLGSIRSRSRPLSMPEEVKSEMEKSIGYDFSGVKFRESPSVAQLGDVAFTQGDTAVFAPGAFSPYSDSGKKVIAHELTHVVQQAQGRVSPEGGLPVNSSYALEHEANQASAPAQGSYASGGQVAPLSLASAEGAPAQGFLGIGKLFKKIKNAFSGSKEAGPAASNQPPPEEKMTEDELIARTNQWMGSDVAKEKSEKTGLSNIDSLKLYTGSAFNAINKTLRGTSDAETYRGANKKFNQGLATVEGVNEISNQISDTLGTTPLEKGMTVYRGASTGFTDFLAQMRSKETGVDIDVDDLIHNPKLLTGMTYNDKAFSSTSTSFDVAKKFSKGDDGGGKARTVSTINVPKGAKGAYVAPYSKYQHEKEFLLDKNSKFKISDAKKIMKQKDGKDTDQLDYIELILDLIEESEEGKLKG